MDSTLFDELQQAMTKVGPAGAIDRLCSGLRERKDYSGLFYAMLMKKRFELDVSPLPTGPSSDLPAAVHQSYEEGIREAARLVGKLLLEEGNVLQAWNYFRMLGEPEPVVQALEKYQPDDSEDFQQIIQLAFQQGAHPRKGFEWILQRYGICSAITTMSNQLNGPQFPHGSEVRDHCINQLVRALHQQLIDRIRNDVVRREGSVDAALSVSQLIAGRDWLFDDDNYHVDVSHLNAVVQMAALLSPCEELNLVRQMCEYGKRLAPQFRSQGDPPFEDTYQDYGIFLDIVAGENVETGLAHFRAKCENPDPDFPSTMPAEVLVNLLLRLGRTADALAMACKFLQHADERELSCPSIAELCRRVSDYQTLAAVSRERGDPVHFLAGMIAARKQATPNGK